MEEKDAVNFEHIKDKNLIYSRIKKLVEDSEHLSTDLIPKTSNLIKSIFEHLINKYLDNYPKYKTEIIKWFEFELKQQVQKSEENFA